MAVASLVLGIISLLGFLFSTWIGLIAGIVGIVLATMAKKAGQPGPATAGLVLSIIGTTLCALLIIAALMCAASLGLI